MDTIFIDYCNYYQLRFGKQPKFIRKIPEKCIPITTPPPSSNIKRKQQQQQQSIDRNLEITGTDAILVDKNLSSTIKIQSAMSQSKIIEECDNFQIYRRPLSMYENYSSEWKEIADIVCRFYNLFL